MANTQALPLRNQALIGASFAALAAIGFSAKAIMIKLAYAEHVDALTLLALRMAFSAPLFLLVALWSGRQSQAPALERRDWFAVLALGLLGYYLSSLLDFVGLQYISASLERLVLFLYPTLVVLLTAVLFKQPIRTREAIPLAVSYAGIALVFMHDARGSQPGLVIGASLVFIATVSYSLYLIGAGHFIARIGSVRFTAYAMTVACMATLAHFGLTHSLTNLALPSRVYALGLALALFSTVLPAFMIAAGIRRIGAGRTALIGAIGPVATLLIAHWVLAEGLSAQQIAGSALVLAGVLAVSMAKS
jgi:drug/metabolite transporter (DMT)-like permease